MGQEGSKLWGRWGYVQGCGLGRTGQWSGTKVGKPHGCSKGRVHKAKARRCRSPGQAHRVPQQARQTQAIRQGQAEPRGRKVRHGRKAVQHNGEVCEQGAQVHKGQEGWWGTRWGMGQG